MKFFRRKASGLPCPAPACPPGRTRSGGDRVQWTKQEAAAGAALRFLQAPSAVRRKNRLSARVETFSGAAGGARTRGLLFPKQARFQLRYSDMERAEAVNFFRASAMAMADKRPFASGCPHEKGPRSVVVASPSAWACCRGTYPPPAAGCMVTAFALDQKSRRRRGAPPPAALDGISIARFFGSKVQCSEQAEIFCDFPDKIPVPLLGSPLRDIEPQGCTKYSV